jgi:CelD/BcsL family acetyltransferase involved in cellulose biosynthesis
MERVFELGSHHSSGVIAAKIEPQSIDVREYIDFSDRVTNLACSFYEQDFEALVRYVKDMHRVSTLPQATHFLLSGDSSLAHALALESCARFNVRAESRDLAEAVLCRKSDGCFQRRGRTGKRKRERVGPTIRANALRCIRED